MTPYISRVQVLTPKGYHFLVCHCSPTSVVPAEHPVVFQRTEVNFSAGTSGKPVNGETARPWSRALLDRVDGILDGCYIFFYCKVSVVRLLVTNSQFYLPQVHEATFPKFFELPAGVPDSRMMRDPIWSTWVKYHVDVNDSRVLDFARAVTEHGFNNSQVCAGLGIKYDSLGGAKGEYVA